MTLENKQKEVKQMGEFKVGDFVKRKVSYYNARWCKFCGEQGLTADTVFTVYNIKPGNLYLSLNGEIYEVGFGPDYMEVTTKAEAKEVDNNFMVIRDDCQNVVLKNVTLEKAKDFTSESKATYTICKIVPVAKIKNVKEVTTIKAK